MNIFLNWPIHFYLHNTINLRHLTQRIISCCIPTKWWSYRDNRFCDVASPYIQRQLETRFRGERACHWVCWFIALRYTGFGGKCRLELIRNELGSSSCFFDTFCDSTTGAWLADDTLQRTRLHVSSVKWWHLSVWRWCNGRGSDAVSAWAHDIHFTPFQRSASLHRESKKQDTKLLAITSLNINRFSKFFSSRLGSKFGTNACLNIPPGFTYVATLPCAIWMHKNGIILKYVLQLMMNHKVV